MDTLITTILPETVVECVWLTNLHGFETQPPCFARHHSSCHHQSVSTGFGLQEHLKNEDGHFTHFATSPEKSLEKADASCGNLEGSLHRLHPGLVTVSANSEAQNA